MKRFIKKVLLIILIFLCIYILEICLSFFLIGNRYEASYCASFLDKMRRLEHTEGPKIILVGNSNLAFGINSPMMERELGMPIVNLGFHGGLGNAFHEEMVLQSKNITPGDYVIVAHSSYSHESDFKEMDLAWITLEHHVEYYRVIPKKDLYRFAIAFPQYVYHSAKLWAKGVHFTASGPYARTVFNAQGDNIYPRKKGKYVLKGKPKLMKSPTDECCNNLNALHDFVTANGAYMLIAAPPFMRGMYANEPDAIQQLENGLKGKLKADVISNFQEYVFPPHAFFDTDLHLIESARNRRTRLLISDIRRWQKLHGMDRPAEKTIGKRT